MTVSKLLQRIMIKKWLNDLFYFCSIVFLLLLFPFDINAQVSGYMGKHFLLKNELGANIIERGFQVELEVILLRQLTISIIFKHDANKIAQHLQGYYKRFNKNPDTKGQIKSWNLILELRHYLDKSLPAPMGLYGFFNMGKGIGDISGNYYIYKIRNNPDTDEYYYFLIENARFIHVNYGFGYQKVFKKYFSVDYQIGVQYTAMKTSDEYNYLIDHLAHKYGKNFIDFTTLSSSEEKSKSIGIAMQLKIGVFIY